MSNVIQKSNEALKIEKARQRREDRVADRIEAEFRAACAKLQRTKNDYVSDPVEYRLREFTLALRDAERLTKIVLALDGQREKNHD